MTEVGPHRLGGQLAAHVAALAGLVVADPGGSLRGSGEDLDERLGETYAARTIGQLWHAIRELPVQRAAAPVPRPLPQGNSTAGKVAVWTLVGVGAITVAPVAVAVVFGLVAALAGVLLGLTIAFAPVIAIGALIVVLVQRAINRPAAHSWAAPPPA